MVDTILGLDELAGGLSQVDHRGLSRVSAVRDRQQASRPAANRLFSLFVLTIVGSSSVLDVRFCPKVWARPGPTLKCQSASVSVAGVYRSMTAGAA